MSRPMRKITAVPVPDSTGGYVLVKFDGDPFAKVTNVPGGFRWETLGVFGYTSSETLATFEVVIDQIRAWAEMKDR